MPTSKTAAPPYRVVVHNDPRVANAVRFTFSPSGRGSARGPADVAELPRDFIMSVKGGSLDPTFDWIRPPSDAIERRTLEDDVRGRLAERDTWIRRVTELVDLVADWAGKLDWTTRRIEKRIEDSRLGTHKVPALVMQSDTVRVLLEPIAASGPGTDGIVDLCLMPGYDDIASLYYWENAWHIQYVFPMSGAVAGIREGTSNPFSQTTLKMVLEEMKTHAE